MAPPGSGKTLLGMEIVRRLGRAGARARAELGDPGSVAARRSGVRSRAGSRRGRRRRPIACLTYQALARLDDPADALGELAERRWASERATSTGQTPAEVERRPKRGAVRPRLGGSASSPASPRRSSARSRAPSTATLRARETCSVQAPRGTGRAPRATASGRSSSTSATISRRSGATSFAPRWRSSGGGSHLVGLTATPPEELTEGGAGALRGAARSGRLHRADSGGRPRAASSRPYQELAWLTPVLETERAWLAEHDLRFQELITTLHDDSGEAMSLPVMGDRPDARAATRRRGRRRCLLAFVPAPAPGAGAGGRAFLRLGRARAAARCAEG